MGADVLVDAGFLIALLSRGDQDHDWAVAESAHLRLPWRTCDSALSEAFHLLGSRGLTPLAELLRRGAVLPAFDLARESPRVLALLEKYRDVPMSLADACLVRMSETTLDPVVLTTDSDFRIYRRHGRQTIPVLMPRR